MTNTYDIGDLARMSAAFTLVSNGTAANPTAVTCKVRKPDGSTVTLVYGTDAALIKDSTGNYHADIATDQFGRWYYRFEGTGAVIAAGDNEFDVRQNAFA